MEMEFEQKGLINEEDFKRICKVCEIKIIIHQTNYYFETKDNFFKNNNSALRVREKNNSYELTLKVGLKSGNIEHNFPISKEEFLALSETKKIPPQLYKFIDKNLILDTKVIIETYRHLIDYENHTIEVDKTNFNGFIDYEIEVESENIKKATSVLNSFTSNIGINYEKSMPKIKRYFLYNNPTK